jgi:LPS export ABC transporter protein LptC
VKVDFFDKKQIHVAVLNSQRAEVDQKTNDMKAIGNVVAISDSGITLYTDTLYWDAKNEKMSTEDSVMITTLEKDTLYGIGFESDSDLENWKILKPSGVTERN